MTDSLLELAGKGYFRRNNKVIKPPLFSITRQPPKFSRPSPLVRWLAVFTVSYFNSTLRPVKVHADSMLRYLLYVKHTLNEVCSQSFLVSQSLDKCNKPRYIIRGDRDCGNNT